MRTARSSVTGLALLLAAAASSAQSLEEKLEAKLKEPFVANAPWVLDYGEALAKAKAEKKLVFAYFTRSYSP
jgi:hypothetical protein